MPKKGKVTNSPLANIPEQAKGILKKEKISEVEKISKIFQDAQSVIIADYQGLNVEEVTDLRKQLRDNDASFIVSKNTLMWRAAQEHGLDLEDVFAGPTALGYSESDPAAAAKIITEFAKKHKGIPKVKAGVLEGNVIDLAKVEFLGSLPSREQLLAQVLMTMNAPIQSFVGLGHNLLKSFVTALDAIAKEKQEN